MTLDELFADIAPWSEATFGSTASRGPAGPLKHMAVEILAELLPDPRDVGEVLAAVIDKRERMGVQSALQDPADPMELADLLILWCDAVRRANQTPAVELGYAREKMVINKRRTWPPPTPAGISQHAPENGP